MHVIDIDTAGNQLAQQTQIAEQCRQHGQAALIGIGALGHCFYIGTILYRGKCRLNLIATCRGIEGNRFERRRLFIDQLARWRQHRVVHCFSHAGNFSGMQSPMQNDTQYKMQGQCGQK